MIDDASLFHGTYDPEKARQYYLRTRKLKGKRPTSATPDSPGRGGRPATKAVATRQGSKSNRADTKSRQAELKAQKVALEKRLDKLRDVLKEKVDAAKKRNVDQQKKNGKGPSDAAPETKVDKADRNAAEKKSKPSKPETPSQKKEKAKKAKEAYEKENPSSLSEDVDILEAQIEDIRAKIQKAVSDAQDRRSKAGENDGKSGFKSNNDEPKGR